MTADVKKETLGFQTEAKQLLHLMIHSLYSNKEIFMRELISNASDAIDKLRFAALADDALLEGQGDYAIQIDLDKKANTITISDNGPYGLWWLAIWGSCHTNGSNGADRRWGSRSKNLRLLQRRQ